MKRFGLYGAIALVVVINGIVLAGVRFNRAGEPDAVVELTERELNLGNADKENSGVTLQLNWHRFDEGETDWFDYKKLEAVGFDCRTPLDAPDAALHYSKALPRKAYAVLEYAGPAWEARQAREKEKLEKMAAEAALGTVTPKALAEGQKRFAWEQIAASRLFAVDVGMDPEKLRKRYANRKGYIITPVLVRLNFHELRNEKGKTSERSKLTGSMEKILTESIRVPRDKQSLLRPMQSRGSLYSYSPYFQRGKDEPEPPRYSVVLNYGKRFEPWVIAVRPLVKNKK